MNSRLSFYYRTFIIGALFVAQSFAQTQQSNDSVTYTPKKPTTKDSIFFSLLTVNHDCCTQIYNAIASVSDTIIYLRYEYYDNPAAGVCMCLVAGKTISFKTGPINAGNYAIYEASSIYCAPGSVCPMLAIFPQCVGQITVIPASGILPVVNTRDPVLQFTWTQRSGSITLRYRQPSAVSVFAAIYNARGSLVKKMRMQKTNAEQYEAVWETGGHDNAPVMPGAYFVGINAGGETIAMEKISVLK